MSQAPVLLETRPADGVAWLRLNRPEVLNALNLALRQALAEAFTRLDADPQVRVLVISGGERAFCAGADLGEYVDADPVELLQRRMDLLWDAIAQCRKPVIAAVRGHALGGGCELAMHADILLAAQSARFGQPEVRIGIMPGGGATQRLVQALGKFRAMQLLMTGEPMDAAQAHATGLVSECLEDAALEPRALALASELAKRPAQALRLIKEAVLHGLSAGLAQGLAHERALFHLAFATADKTEGMQARLARREPVFQHR